MTQANMTRRSFTKSVAALGAVAALGMGAARDFVAVDPAVAAESGQTTIVKTSCRACIANCAVLAHVKDGRVIKLEGIPKAP